MRATIGWAVILLGLATTVAWAQGNNGVWDASDDEQYGRFKGYASRCEAHVKASKWDDAMAFLKPQIYFLERLERDRGLADHPTTKIMRARYEAAKRCIDNRVTTDPGAGVGEGNGVRVGSGIDRLDAALAKSASGNRLQLSGRFMAGDKGQDGAAGWVVRVPTLTLEGGYAADFVTRDLTDVANATVLGRDPAAKGAAKPLLVGEGITRLVLDGIVFDGSAHQSWDAAGRLVPSKSLAAPLVRVAFTGSVVLRRCAFLNGAAGLVHLIGKGGEVTVEQCAFVGSAGTALVVEGEGTRLVVRQCSFSCIHPDPRAKADPGVAIDHRGTGLLEVRACAFTHAGVGIRCTGGNLTLHKVFDNASYLLAKGFFEDPAAAKRFADESSIEERGLGDAAGNKAVDFDMQLDPVAQLGWLQSTAAAGADAAALEQSIGRARQRLGTATEPAKAANGLPVKYALAHVWAQAGESVDCAAGVKPPRKE